MQVTAAAREFDGHVKTPGGIWVQGDPCLSSTLSETRLDPNPCIIHGCKLETKKNPRSGLEVLADASNTQIGKTLDISWLPYCAEHYQISPKLSDYVLVEVPIVVADIPNRNLDAFPYVELATWRTANGEPAFGTFRRKPVHQDHDNLVDARAKGVIFDASFVQFRGKYHVKILKGFDRTKDARLARLVQEKNRIGHSMGALVEQTECSHPKCLYVSDGTTTCKHINGGAGKGQIIRVNGSDHLIYEKMQKFYFIESSSVEDPAYVIALSERVW